MVTHKIFRKNPLKKFMLVAATVNVEMYDVSLLEMACSLIDSMR